MRRGWIWRRRPRRAPRSRSRGGGSSSRRRTGPVGLEFRERVHHLRMGQTVEIELAQARGIGYPAAEGQREETDGGGGVAALVGDRADVAGTSAGPVAMALRREDLPTPEGPQMTERRSAIATRNSSSPSIC